MGNTLRLSLRYFSWHSRVVGNMNWEKGKNILPLSKLLCPKCGIEAYSPEKDDNYRNSIHRLCIDNSIHNGQFADKKDWLNACKWNYDRIALFFKDTK